MGPCSRWWSRPVTTARTPGTSHAPETSRSTIQACGTPARRTLPCNIPGKRTSTPYRAAPVTLATASTRGTDLPTVRYVAVTAPNRSSGVRAALRRPLPHRRGDVLHELVGDGLGLRRHHPVPERPDHAAQRHVGRHRQHGP